MAYVSTGISEIEKDGSFLHSLGFRFKKIVLCLTYSIVPPSSIMCKRGQVWNGEEKGGKKRELGTMWQLPSTKGML